MSATTHPATPARHFGAGSHLPPRSRRGRPDLPTLVVVVGFLGLLALLVASGA